MRGLKKIPTIALVGKDGNTFSIMGRISKALQTLVLMTSTLKNTSKKV